MIYISQGSRQSIGLEVLFKSLSLLSSSQISNIVLCCNLERLESELSYLSVPITIHDTHIQLSNGRLPLLEPFHGGFSECKNSLLSCLDLIDPEDALVTLPTSKDQFENPSILGYTEFFRRHFKDPYLGMFFYSDDLKHLLLSDHIPLSQVPKMLTTEFIIRKVEKFLFNTTLKFKRIVFSGINPHAGEGGLLGTQDKELKIALANLSKKFSDIEFHGPFSADTLHLYNFNKQETLYIYAFHDQSLPYFKGTNSFLGLNITVGLPFLRVSVDHGTSPQLYRKNIANYSGMNYLFNFLSKSGYL